MHAWYHIASCEGKVMQLIIDVIAGTETGAKIVYLPLTWA